jgi:hypothetical protein
MADQTQAVFTPEHAATLTFEDGQLYGWAAREGRLPFAYWALDNAVKHLVPAYGVVTGAARLALPVPFVRAWAVELGLVALARADRSARSVHGSDQQRNLASPAFALSDDGIDWMSALSIPA